MILDLSEARFIPPRADKHVEAFLRSWDYEMYFEQNDLPYDSAIDKVRDDAVAWLQEYTPDLLPILEALVLRTILRNIGIVVWEIKL